MWHIIIQKEDRLNPGNETTIRQEVETCPDAGDIDYWENFYSDPCADPLPVRAVVVNVFNT